MYTGFIERSFKIMGILLCNFELFKLFRTRSAKRGPFRKAFLDSIISS
jgi:hypothetical protein